MSPITAGKENVNPSLSSQQVLCDNGWVNSSPTKPSAISPKVAKKAIWKSADDEILVECLKQQQLEGNQSDNGFKPVVWTAAASALKGSEKRSGGTPKSAKGCKDHFKTLKEHFLIVKALRDLSGFGWDDTTNMVTAPDDVWDRYLAEHSEALRWRTKPFPIYDAMLLLVEGRHATGAGAFRVAEMHGSDGVVGVDDNSIGNGIDAGYDDYDDDLLPDDEDPIPWSPSPPPEAKRMNGRKRAASVDLDVVATSVSAKKSRTSGPVAVSDVASALREIAKSFTTSEQPHDSALSTPQRRTSAIRVVGKDSELDGTERIKAMRLFKRDIAAADSYLAIEDPIIRAEFIRLEVEDL